MDCPRRRTLLGVGGAAVAGVLAGCLGGSSDSNDESETNGSNESTGPDTSTGSNAAPENAGRDRDVADLDTVPPGETVEAGGREVRLDDPAVRDSPLYEPSATGLALASSTGSHYLLATVAVTAPTATATPFALALPGGESRTYAETFGATHTGGDEVAFSVVTPAGERSFTVAVGGSPNGTGGQNGSNGTTASTGPNATDAATVSNASDGGD
jgi:hypothetical protein